MPVSPDQIHHITVLADSDTRWKWGALAARRIAPEARLDGRLLRGRATPTTRQLSELGIAADSLREVTMRQFLAEAEAEAEAEAGARGGHHDAASDPDSGGPGVVLLACVGGTVQAALHGLARVWGQAPRPRPVTVTGYVGVVYEKLADGLLLRHGADVVIANSPQDARRFRDVYEGVGADASCVTEAALPFLDGAPYRGPDAARRFTVVFAAQPSVPASREERTYLLRRAARHAERHPDRDVLVKLRSKPGEHTTHVEEFPLQRLAARLDPPLPPGVRLVYGRMGEVLDRADLLVTVSSTAALEAMHRGMPTAVLTDFGVREALGNHHFTGSGCLASWDELDDGLLPRADADWLRANGVGADDPFRLVRERVEDLAAAGQLPPPRPYYTPRTAPAYLPGVLARHGLDPQGRPVGTAPPAEDGQVRRLTREFTRNAARAAYRHGVQRVAPVIRRLGEL
ncbi:DUF6716 putative glycosyltransferase [Streptantibioticus parmotrematis]|uniref:DUF6716 putative glycosyltransferase n=1 Tax=Streptantibioticus parmotrematis TaxID=2873249 RepID=UPI0027DFCBDB|nr:DUF6716 putative glycosyltransferase [Streptantibioticus parmotrematis]